MVLKSRHGEAADGSPTFMGLSGRRLNLMVSVIATNGFLLFGYAAFQVAGRFFRTALTIMKDTIKVLWLVSSPQTLSTTWCVNALAESQSYMLIICI